ncbi:MAG: alpha/beta hydrolase, partial [Frankiales bacterium]|nr:alpha/beta hydrolase [Frankiales bacterium]
GIMDELGVDRAHVVGHEWGAGVAWQLASRHPERVLTLTAISIPHPVAYAEALEHDPDQQRRARQLASFRRAGGAEEAMLLEGGLDDYLDGTDPEVDVAAIRALVAEPGVLKAGLNWYRGMHLRDVEGLQKVTVPTMYVWSDGDPGIGRLAAETSGRYVEATYRFEVLEGFSRFLPEAAADRLAELLLEHLD